MTRRKRTRSTKSTAKTSIVCVKVLQHFARLSEQNKSCEARCAISEPQSTVSLAEFFFQKSSQRILGAVGVLRRIRGVQKAQPILFTRGVQKRTQEPPRKNSGRCSVLRRKRDVQKAQPNLSNRGVQEFFFQKMSQTSFR